MSNKLKDFFTLTDDQADSDTIHDSILKGLKINGSPLIILFCAIIIASVGLQLNSTAVVIGAMLISPIMSPILAIGYGISTYNADILKRGILYFLLQVSIAIIASTIFYMLSPIKTASDELLARTSPSFFDVLIALFGGIAGIIGITRIEKTNVIPGVAIATALMPPLCTIGFGLATQNWSFARNAAYLFSINAFYIVLATVFIVKYLSINSVFNPPKEFKTRVRKFFMIATIIITAPSIFLSYQIAVRDNTVIEENLKSFIAENLSDDNRAIIESSINTDEEIIKLVILGQSLTEADIEKLNDKLNEYNLDDFELIIIQDRNDLQETD